MHILDHPNIVSLKHCLLSMTDKEEHYLNLVFEYVPKTVNPLISRFSKLMPFMASESLGHSGGLGISRTINRLKRKVNSD